MERERPDHRLARGSIRPRPHTGLSVARAAAAAARRRMAFGKRPDDEAAIVAFDEAIAMARAVGLDDTRSEALRGLSLARLGLREQAEATAALAERVPDHVALAELYLALAELYLALDLPQKAREHALVGYRWGWADGPPWCHHWALQTSRAVLAALGEPEPQLPPFDPTRIRTIEYEADIRRLIEEHAAKQF
jgi:tetratricopeptide (TPR) repeat protein